MLMGFQDHSLPVKLGQLGQMAACCAPIIQCNASGATLVLLQSSGAWVLDFYTLGLYFPRWFSPFALLAYSSYLALYLTLAQSQPQLPPTLAQGLVIMSLASLPSLLIKIGFKRKIMSKSRLLGLWQVKPNSGTWVHRSHTWVCSEASRAILCSVLGGHVVPEIRLMTSHIPIHAFQLFEVSLWSL